MQDTILVLEKYDVPTSMFSGQDMLSKGFYRTASLDIIDWNTRNAPKGCERLNSKM